MGHGKKWIMLFSKRNAYYITLVILCPLFFSCFFLSPVFAADEPFTFPSNWGGTGLMEIPTARILTENSYRIGIGQVAPYRYFYGAVSPFRGLEIDGRITEELGVSSGFEDQDNYKDKTIDLKYRILGESKYFPAVAIGIMDPHGTRVFSSQYVVASKQIYPFDFTLGFGNGRFGKVPFLYTEDLKLEVLTDPGDWLKESQFFWGIQFVPSEKYAFMVEYSPIKFHEQINDLAQREYFKEPVPSKYNFGFRYKPAEWSEIDLSFQRGNRIGLSASMLCDIGRPLVPIYNLIHKRAPVGQDTLSDKIAWTLYHSGFSNISVDVASNDLLITAQNDKFLYSTKAIGVILEIIESGLPANIESVHIVLKEKGVPVIEFTALRIDIIDLFAGKITLNEFLLLSSMGTDITEASRSKSKYVKRLAVGLNLNFETFLNDPSGFFKYRLGIRAWTNYHLWRGASFITGLATYPINNISTAHESISMPVRSDLVLYKQENFTLDRLMFEQVDKLVPGLYGKFSAGLLEVQYAGVDAEVAMPLLDGRILIGLSGSAVKKRDYDKPFGLKQDDVKDVYTTAFLNTRFNFSGEEIALDIKAGRFLAGDNGVRFTVLKHIKGVTLQAWYSVTDTSIFSDEFNKGYNDKGIGILIPMRLFKGTDSKTIYKYLVSPWTRDTGQDIDHFSTLMDFIGRNTKVFLDKDEDMMYRLKR